MTTPFVINPLDPVFRRDPYAAYARGRREFPAHALEGLPSRIISVFRHADILSVLKDWQRFSSDFDARSETPEEIEALGSPPPPSMLTQDPPVHDRLRGLVNKAFTPRIVRQLEPRLREVAGELVDAALARGQVDLVEALTYPLPVVAIAEMIGVPTSDHAQFKVWSDQLVSNLGTGFFGGLELDDIKRQRTLRLEMFDYFMPLAEKRKEEPRDDLLTGLVQAEHEGTRLSQDEMLQMLILLLVAGNETTTTLIGNAVVTLCEHPAELQRLREDPALMSTAVEEVLRFSSPIQFDPRVCTGSGELHGVGFDEGDIAICWLGSANRDEAVFETPERFDVGREKNPHLAFGHGLHHCLGHNLARLEAEVALSVLLERTEKLELMTPSSELPLHPSPVFRSFREIGVRLA